MSRSRQAFENAKRAVVQAAMAVASWSALANMIVTSSQPRIAYRDIRSRIWRTASPS
jgi:hypothetical protein